jgi:glucose/mannose-6-phosphate isomerase
VIDLDDEAVLRVVDAANMLDVVLDQPANCRDGYRVGLAAPDLPRIDDVTSIAFCGMGGSGIAGDVIAAVGADRLSVPVNVIRSPELPSWCGPRSLILASSYSGDTGETLTLFDAAVARRGAVVAITAGGALAERAEAAGVPCIRLPAGFAMPRAAFGYLVMAPLGALEAMGALTGIGPDLDEAVRALERIVESGRPSVPGAANPAKSLARRIGDRVPVIWGAAGVGAVAASRWKTQLNENAKVPAFAAALPELDHNEVVGWSPGRGEGFFLVVLRHAGEHPGVAARFALSTEIATAAGVEVAEVRSDAGSPLGALLELVLLGDLVSTYLALARGVDPTPIEAIARLKRALAESSTGPAGGAGA